MVRASMSTMNNMNMQSPEVMESRKMVSGAF